MAIQGYGTQAPRIGKWKGDILAHAIPCEVLNIAGVPKAMPKNVSDTVVYRRWVPYAATALNPNILIPSVSPATDVETDASNRVDEMLTANTLAEGTTPTPDSLVAQDITVVLKQYGCLYAFTDKTADLYEDDVAQAMKVQVAERMTLIREMELYSKVRASTNRFYGGTGTTLATVDGAITLPLLRKIARSLQANHGRKPTSILAPTPNISTKFVEAAYLVFCHSDVEADLRDIEGYTPVAGYGSRKPIHEQEIGSCEQFRFIVSPELVAFQNGGAAVGVTGLQSTGGANVDVYPVIVTAKDGYGTVSLRGMNSFDLSIIPIGNKDSADPLGQRGYVGAKFYAASVLLNNQWVAVALVGVSEL